MCILFMLIELLFVFLKLLPFFDVFYDCCFKFCTLWFIWTPGLDWYAGCATFPKPGVDGSVSKSDQIRLGAWREKLSAASGVDTAGSQHALLPEVVCPGI